LLAALQNTPSGGNSVDSVTRTSWSSY